MARLNEAPQPAGESIDALKRRFVRQNRELARVNSTQSVRIRNLESEISSLQSENVCLRGQIIKLRCDLDDSIDRGVFEKVDDVRLKIEAKLMEMRGLVNELAENQESTTKHQSQRHKSTRRVSLSRSPNQSDGNNALMLSEMPGENDGRLPTILEDKYFPRRSLEAKDLLATSPHPADSIDSPDLGPPPVAHFDEGDPIKFDAKLTHSESNRELDDLQQLLSANLETRKKRRENPHQKGTDNAIDMTGLKKQDVALDNPTGQKLKSGAKRKLSMRDDTKIPASDTIKDGFRFNRMISGPMTGTAIDSKVPNSSGEGNDGAQKAQDQLTSTTIEQSRGKGQAKKGNISNNTVGGRQPLGLKSVNSNPQSPAKETSKSAKGRNADLKRDLIKCGGERNRATDVLASGKPTGSSSENLTSASSNQHMTFVEVPPETPITSDLDPFSPHSSKSTERTESRDTPPPPDLGLATADNSFGRASRRPKGSVNYAQPNLRDKMRRPTRELVDAVAAEAQSRQSNGYKLDDSTLIKQEEDQNASPMWKTKHFGNEMEQPQVEGIQPTSSLANQPSFSLACLPASAITDEKKGTSTISRHLAERDTKKNRSGATSPVATVATSSQKAWMRKIQGMPELNQKNKANDNVAERADIYEFVSSSPGDITDGDLKPKEQEGRAKPLRSSRRHSTVTAAPDHRKASLSISRDQAEISGEGSTGKRGGERKEKESAYRLKHVQSVTALAPGLDEIPGRGGRAASRRRSMML